MIRINLLPHRESFRKQQIVEYIIVLAVAVALTVMAIVGVDSSSTEDLVTLESESQSLKAQNTRLSKKIGELKNLDSLRKEVEGKLAIVDELQAGRFRSFTTLVAISEGLPSNTWITEIMDNGKLISLSGFGESSKSIANFLRFLENSELFDNVKLVVDQVAISNGARVRKFQLTFARLGLAEQELKRKKLAEKGVL
ncbi:MAG: hypothetical protein AUK35_11150 [Zetaproteobacteria bacterium CG2_30_46_52]|nr:MAG: hypothetical protein AUK35_11150 [Zetaproteobacteria bacterium CG2_30_46_52]